MDITQMRIEADEEKLLEMLSADGFIKSNNFPDVVILDKEIYQYLSKDEIQGIADQCGFLCSFHERDDWSGDSDIWLTPEHSDALLREDEIYFHLSECDNLDTVGITPQSRLKDNDFDIYRNRVYLGYYYPEREELVEAVDNVKDGVDRLGEKFFVYEIKLPLDFQVYQDPTMWNAAYVEQFIPAQYIRKVDISEYDE